MTDDRHSRCTRELCADTPEKRPDRVTTATRFLTVHFEHAVDREQRGEVVVATRIGTMRVRGDRLADLFPCAELPRLHTTTLPADTHHPDPEGSESCTLVLAHRRAQREMSPCQVAWLAIAARSASSKLRVGRHR